MGATLTRPLRQHGTAQQGAAGIEATVGVADHPALAPPAGIGRLVLHLFGRTEPKYLEQSDCICSALQLINFWQDVAVDWQKNRVYIPQTDFPHFRVGEADIAAGRWSPNWAALMDFEIDRAQALMRRGAPLVHALPGRLGWEIRLTVQGGLRILERIRQVRGDVFRHRPKLGKRDWAVILGRSLTM